MRIRTALICMVPGIAALAASACGGDSESFTPGVGGEAGAAGSATMCTPGTTVPCVGPDACQGLQICSDYGYWESCLCTGTGGGGGGGGTGTGGGGGALGGTGGITTAGAGGEAAAAAAGAAGEPIVAGAAGSAGAAVGGSGGAAAGAAGAAGSAGTAGTAGSAGAAGTAGAVATGGTGGTGGTTGGTGGTTGGTGGATGGTGGGAPVCGNGILEAGEGCDDGNGVDVDACPDGQSGLCQNATCGDSMVRRDIASGNAGYEQCDDGNTTDNDGCSSICVIEGSCGDGNQDAGEQCDLGGANDDNASGTCPSVCRTNCQCPNCGDGVTDFVLGEECDDLNTVDGDGCSALCQIETVPSCGDGILDIDNGEECDDANLTNGDGCDDTCQLEPIGQSCGDGNVDALEKCDDNNTANGDGCNPTCNLLTDVTTLATGIIGNALAVDDTSLWIAGCNFPGPTQCSLQRIDIDNCLVNSNCTPALVVAGTCGAPQDGPAATAQIGCIGTMATDGTTLWFADGHLIRALDIPTLTVSTVAGDPNLCAAIDGTGTSALFHDIRGLTYYDGYVYLLDGCEEVLRRLDPVTGAVVTIAGQRFADPTVPQTGPNQYQCQPGFTCITGTPTDGQGLNAIFGSPRYMTADNSGNLYITDTNGESLRTYNTVTGWVGTLIGGTQGYVDGTGAAVQLDRPRGVTSDGTSVYWGEQNQQTVRQVVIQTAEASTLVGVRACAGAADGTGADATQDWSSNCNAGRLNGLPRINTPLGGIAFHYSTQSIFLLESGRLRRIE